MPTLANVDAGRKRLGAGRRLLALLGAGAWTLAFFLVLPFIQAISQTGDADLMLRAVDTTALTPPPPPPSEPEPEKPEDEPEKPPELQDDAPPLDLSQLELALNPGVGGGWTTADFAMKLDQMAGGAGGDSLFSLADLDQQPRAIYRQNPQMTPAIRRKAPGTVNIVFVVDEDGRVQNAVVQSSPDPVFEQPALDAIKKWKFEPGKRAGKAVSTRMRVPITFPDK